MAAKKSAAKKTTARKTTARKSTAKKAAPEAAVQTDEPQLGHFVPAGGIDPKLEEQRDAQRELEAGVQFARASEPAQLDPKLAEIRDKTIKREAELANRSTRETPARG